MRGSWSRGVVLRWILLLLIQSASQEREEAMQKLALKTVLRVIDSCLLYTSDAADEL